MCFVSVKNLENRRLIINLPKSLIALLPVFIAATVLAQPTQGITNHEVVNDTNGNNLLQKLEGNSNNPYNPSADSCGKVDNTATHTFLPLSIMRQPTQTFHDNKWQISPNNYQGFKIDEKKMTDPRFPVGPIIQGGIAH